MQPADVADIAARHVPGKGPARISRLRAGLVNETYRVVRDGHAYSLRVAAANPRALGLDWHWELRVLERAVAAGLAPAVVYADPQSGILVLRWAEGQQWRCGEAARAVNVGRIAELLRRIHALAAPQPARQMRPAQWIELYAAAARPASLELADAAASRSQALDALPSVPGALCHSDLHRFNLVDRGASLLLLDWEYAHVCDPLWDVAGWSANNDFVAADARLLFTQYAGRSPSKEEWARLQILIWLYDYVCWLWSALYLSLRGTGVASAGVAERAAVLQDRLTQTASSRGG